MQGRGEFADFFHEQKKRPRCAPRRIRRVVAVADEVLEGGRSRTLAFEESGKALSSLMLTMPIAVPADYGRKRYRITLKRL